MIRQDLTPTLLAVPTVIADSESTFGIEISAACYQRSALDGFEDDGWRMSGDKPEPDFNCWAGASVNLDDRHQRVHATVSVFSTRIMETLRTEETAIDLWFVVIPDIVYENCRPRSRVPTELQVKSEYRFSPSSAQRTRAEPMLFDQLNKDAEPYHYEVDFHNRLKARLLSSQALTQIVRESTIAPVSYALENERSKRTAAFYKAGGRPWRNSPIGSPMDIDILYVCITLNRELRVGPA